MVADANAAQARLDDEQSRLLTELVAAPAELEAASLAEDTAIEAMREAEETANRTTEDAAASPPNRNPPAMR